MGPDGFADETGSGILVRVYYTGKCTNFHQN